MVRMAERDVRRCCGGQDVRRFARRPDGVSEGEWEWVVRLYNEAVTCSADKAEERAEWLSDAFTAAVLYMFAQRGGTAAMIRDAKFLMYRRRYYVQACKRLELRAVPPSEAEHRMLGVEKAFIASIFVMVRRDGQRVKDAMDGLFMLGQGAV